MFCLLDQNTDLLRTNPEAGTLLGSQGPEKKDSPCFDELSVLGVNTNLSFQGNLLNWGVKQGNSPESPSDRLAQTNLVPVSSLFGSSSEWMMPRQTELNVQGQTQAEPWGGTLSWALGCGRGDASESGFLMDDLKEEAELVREEKKGISGGGICWGEWEQVWKGKACSCILGQPSPWGWGGQGAKGPDSDRQAWERPGQVFQKVYPVAERKMELREVRLEKEVSLGTSWNWGNQETDNSLLMGFPFFPSLSHFPLHSQLWGEWLKGHPLPPLSPSFFFYSLFWNDFKFTR